MWLCWFAATKLVHCAKKVHHTEARCTNLDWQAILTSNLIAKNSRYASASCRFYSNQVPPELGTSFACSAPRSTLAVCQPGATADWANKTLASSWNVWGLQTNQQTRAARVGAFLFFCPVVGVLAAAQQPLCARSPCFNFESFSSPATPPRCGRPFCISVSRAQSG